MHAQQFLGVLIVASSMLFGCAGPGEDGQTSSLVYVVERTPGEDVTVEEDRLIFPVAGNEDLLERQPGDILASSRGHGFLRSVKSVDVSGSDIVVLTEQARLGDAIIEGEATDAFEINELDGKWDLEGKADDALFNGAIELANDLLFAASGAKVKLAKASLSFKPILYLDLKISGGEVAYFKAVAEGRLHADLVVDIHTAKAFALENDIEVPLWHSKPKYFTQFVGPVPIVEEVTLRFGVGVDLRTTGKMDLKLGAELNGHAKLGAVYHHQKGWKQFKERSFDMDATHKVLNGRPGFSTRVYFYTELAVKFYGVAGPYIQIYPYLGAERKTTDQGWKAIYGLRGEFGGAIRTLGYELIDVDFLLFDLKFPL